MIHTVVLVVLIVFLFISYKPHFTSATKKQLMLLLASNALNATFSVSKS